MPKLKNKLPSYRHHKGTGQAVVMLNGRDVYLGAYNTPKSRAAYQAAMNEWLSCNRQRQPSSPRSEHTASPQDLTINEMFLAYWAFARDYYRKYGDPTSEAASIKRALTPLLEMYGCRPGRTFGPLALKACRQSMIDNGLTRGVINNHVGRMKRFFKWTVEQELIPAEVYHGLQAVTGLRRGRSSTPESPAVRPVPDDAAVHN